MIAGNSQTNSYADWLDLATKALRGTSPETFTTASRDGIQLRPVWQREQNARPRAFRSVAGPWRIMQRLDHPEPVAANALALEDLVNGANGLTLCFAGAGAARGFGLPDDATAIAIALADIELSMISLRIETSNATSTPLNLMAAIDRTKDNLARVDIDLGLDPIGVLATQGGAADSWDDGVATGTTLFTRWHERGFDGRILTCDGRPYHEAGASEAMELAFVLATAVAYLRALALHGMPLDEARQRLSFLLVADCDQYLTIVKFRTLRRLWARIESACGLNPLPVRVHAETAWRMLSRSDPWTNMLRNVVATVSAGLAGADTITVLPFTTPHGLPDSFARRLARNTQIVLQEEAHLARSQDPVAGSGAFEGMTQALCEAAWAQFQAVECNGGIVECLRSGFVHEHVAKARTPLEEGINCCTSGMVGVNQFILPEEEPVTVLTPASPTRSDEPLPCPMDIAPLGGDRLASPFEQARELAEAQRAQGGSRPKVLVVKLDTASESSSRAKHARSALRIIGFDTVETEFARPLAGLGATWKASGASAACLCASDAAHTGSASTDATDGCISLAEQAARALRTSGCNAILLAKAPGESEPDYRDAGITHFLFQGANLVSITTHLRETTP